MRTSTGSPAAGTRLLLSVPHSLASTLKLAKQQTTGFPSLPQFSLVIAFPGNERAERRDFYDSLSSGDPEEQQQEHA
jgi:hypothetical protein